MSASEPALAAATPTTEPRTVRVQFQVPDGTLWMDFATLETDRPCTAVRTVGSFRITFGLDTGCDLNSTGFRIHPDDLAAIQAEYASKDTEAVRLLASLFAHHDPIVWDGGVRVCQSCRSEVPYSASHIDDEEAYAHIKHLDVCASEAARIYLNTVPPAKETTP